MEPGLVVDQQCTSVNEDIETPVDLIRQVDNQELASAFQIVLLGLEHMRLTMAWRRMQLLLIF
jgi:hypothetical protein